MTFLWRDAFGEVTADLVTGTRNALRIPDSRCPPAVSSGLRSTFQLRGAFGDGAHNAEFVVLAANSISRRSR
ncbi:hypothetical protein ACFWF7_03420 [Nocardia sp. NPDC060256]|uniref:hypothetical protein n=1 Tax=unclassified Nocardia TaxID=2637762 RepID=UPI00364E6C94